MLYGFSHPIKKTRIHVRMTCLSTYVPQLRAASIAREYTPPSNYNGKCKKYMRREELMRERKSEKKRRIVFLSEFDDFVSATEWASFGCDDEIKFAFIIGRKVFNFSLEDHVSYMAKIVQN